MNYIFPLLIVVFSNTVYHICSKSTPENLNAFAAISITYIVGAAVSVILFFITSKGGNLLEEYRHVNWTTYLLGLSIIGLEAGFMAMYKAGWTVGTAQIAASGVLAVVLLVVGFLFYHESVSIPKIIGAAVTIVGLWLLNN